MRSHTSIVWAPESGRAVFCSHWSTLSLGTLTCLSLFLKENVSLCPPCLSRLLFSFMCLMLLLISFFFFAHTVPIFSSPSSSTSLFNSSSLDPPLLSSSSICLILTCLSLSSSAIPSYLNVLCVLNIIVPPFPSIILSAPLSALSEMMSADTPPYSMCVCALPPVPPHLCSSCLSLLSAHTGDILLFLEETIKKSIWQSS